jgi:hypothetical protein
MPGTPSLADQALSWRPRVSQRQSSQMEEAREHVLGVSGVDLGYPASIDAVLGEVAVGPVMEDDGGKCLW